MTSIASSLVGTVSTQTLQTFFVNPPVALTLANTEYSYALPAGTKSFCLQNRGDGLIKFKSAAAGDYWTLFPGQPYYISNIKDTASITVYLESPKPAQTVEIISWA